MRSEVIRALRWIIYRIYFAVPKIPRFVVQHKLCVAKISKNPPVPALNSSRRADWTAATLQVH
jgi:hypothetical protein